MFFSPVSALTLVAVVCVFEPKSQVWQAGTSLGPTWATVPANTKAAEVCLWEALGWVAPLFRTSFAVRLFGAVFGRHLQAGWQLNEAWELKRQVSAGISDPEIEALYQTGLNAGALGGKLLGAGGGGFVLFYCPESALPSLSAAVAPQKVQTFRVDAQGTWVAFLGQD